MARIMVVDDEPAVAQAIADILTEGGHETIVARFGPGLLADVTDREYDLLIIDIVMPEISGWELIKLVREKKPAAHVIAISGGGGAFTASTALEQSRRLGAAATIAKPIGVEALLKVVEVTLRAKPSVLN